MSTYAMGERFIPSLPGWSEEARGMFYNNYKWASSYTRDMIVLDCACGSGYGTDIIASNCAFVVGADVDASILNYARENYRSEKTRFECFSITAIPYPDDYFDVAVSFDTIEHVRDDYKVLPELKRVTKENGYIIISTPLRNFRKERGEEGIFDHTHIREYSAYEWLHMLSVHFKEAEFFTRDSSFEFHQVHLAEYKGSPFDIAFAKLLNSHETHTPSTIEKFKHAHCLQLCDRIKSLELMSSQPSKPPKAHNCRTMLVRLRQRLTKTCAE